LADTDRLERILYQLADDARMGALVERARSLAAAIGAVPPSLEPSKVRERLVAASALEMDWSKDHDAALRREISDLAHQLDPMRLLKQRVATALPEDLAKSASALIAELASIGLFVVPVGELEGWLSDRGIVASKRTKWAWASEAARKVRELGRQDGDVWEFISSVGAYLSRAVAGS
jgi:hypothetical protein